MLDQIEPIKAHFTQVEQISDHEACHFSQGLGRLTGMFDGLRSDTIGNYRDGAWYW